jgi:alkanesulfonate monooxygenase SsuD/methylene tetrahydromethanopterin reductase-like flavin-dependent oxidoreductase (luciferase family)
VSPWLEDYLMTETPWEHRGRRMDESIAVVQGLLQGGYHEHVGKIYDVPAIKIAPTPTEKVPILVGGHSNAALKRAARLDGWMHGGGDPADLPGLLEKLHGFRAAEGRADEPSEAGKGITQEAVDSADQPDMDDTNEG